MEESSSITLPDGQAVVLDDDDDILLHLQAAGKTISTFAMPYPDAGYGGGRLLASPTGRYIIFAYYSGQSEEGLALFTTSGGRLALIYDSGYVYGEDAHYYFAQGEGTLYQTLRTGSYYADMLQQDESGQSFYPFGAINCLDIAGKTWHQCPVLVYPTQEWEEEVTDEGLFCVADAYDNALHLTLPWGEVTVTLPLAEAVVIKGA